MKELYFFLLTPVVLYCAVLIAWAISAVFFGNPFPSFPAVAYWLLP